MTISRKYTFQPGQTIASAQVNEELNQLVNAVNNAYTKTEADQKFLETNGVITNSPVLYNGWKHRTECPVTFVKTQENIVHVIGSCTAGAVGRLNLVCYIPDEYKPTNVVYAEVGASGLLKLQGNRVDIERDLSSAEIFFNLTYKL